MAACVHHAQAPAETGKAIQAAQVQRTAASEGPINHDRSESLAGAVEVLARQWFQGQTSGLPPDELPNREELEQDIADMRDDVLRKVADGLGASDALRNGEPDDAANRAAIARLLEEYKDLDPAVPVFIRLALSKAGDAAYQAGWRLCAIRIIAEASLPEARDMHARGYQVRPNTLRERTGEK